MKALADRYDIIGVADPIATRGFTDVFPPEDAAVIEGLSKTAFGDCAFYAGNDVVDHQIVNMQFQGGVTASLTMNAFNKGGRYIRIFDTKGELCANASDTEITVFTFEDRQTKSLSVMETEESIAGGTAEVTAVLWPKCTIIFQTITPATVPQILRPPYATTC